MTLHEGESSTLESNGLEPIRCSRCGRFQGYAAIADGIVLLLCKNCKNWIIIAEGEVGSNLTSQEIYAMLPTRGQKA